MGFTDKEKVAKKESSHLDYNGYSSHCFTAGKTNQARKQDLELEYSERRKKKTSQNVQWQRFTVVKEQRKREHTCQCSVVRHDGSLFSPGTRES